MDKSAYRSAPLPAVLQSVKHDTRKLIAERLEALFRSADEALFEMADRASTETDQNLFFDSMRIVRLQRASIQQKYIDAYSRSWSSVMSGQPPATNSATLALDADDFSALASDELEISVAAAGISSKVTARFLQPLTHLTKRLETVCEHDLPPELNPLGPHCLNQNFIAALESLDVHIKVLAILLTLFERFVAEELAPVYERANAVLINAGVLPQLSGPVPAQEQQYDTVNTDPAIPIDTLNLPEPQQRPQAKTSYVSETAPDFERLQSLLTAARSPAGPAETFADTAPDNGAALISTAQFMEVLGAVQGSQREEPINLTHPAEPVDFRQLLATKDPAVPEAQEARLEGQSDAVVDLVKMLFDFILNDNNLAIPMQALLGRLQIPVLKVAIIDQTFFAKPSHPARQLLNELAAAGIGWSSASELKRDETYNKIESIVLRVLDGFSGDLTLFSNLIAELRHFVNKEKKKRNQVEQRVKETAAGKAKTREAHKTVQTLINQKACGQHLPSACGHFVSDSWSKVLTYVFVTQGTDSEQWAESIRTLDDLLWASQSLTTDTEVSAREAMLPALLTQLESGITLANLPEAQDQLNSLHHSIEIIHATDQESLDAQGQDQTQCEPGTEPLELIEQPELILLDDAEGTANELENLADPQFIEQIIQLSPGQWVELHDQDGALIRCKLATVAQPGNRYVFVNRKGMKVCERSRNALALALEAEQMNLLAGSQMFDRALESVIGSLQRIHNPER